MKITAPTTSDEVTEVIKSVKNNEATSTDNLQAESLKNVQCVKNEMTEIVNNI